MTGRVLKWSSTRTSFIRGSTLLFFRWRATPLRFPPPTWRSSSQFTRGYVESSWLSSVDAVVRRVSGIRTQVRAVTSKAPARTSPTIVDRRSDRPTTTEPPADENRTARTRTEEVRTDLRSLLVILMAAAMHSLSRSSRPIDTREVVSRFETRTVDCFRMQRPVHTTNGCTQVLLRKLCYCVSFLCYLYPGTVLVPSLVLGPSPNVQG
jgi:hypothetical protein